MARVLKATFEQYNILNGYANGNSLLEFVQDANDNWVVSADVLTDYAFEGIKSELGELEEIDYKPIISE
jgi:hypothetical protein